MAATLEFKADIMDKSAMERALRRIAHEIIVMENGQITDHGTHEELMNRCKFYQRLFAGE